MPPETIDAQNERVLSTLNADGSRRWIKPVPSPGRFLNRRRVVGYSLIALFTILPYLRINSKPPILIDIPARQFTFFGTTLYPTDTLLLALLLLSVFLTIFLLTAIAGRVWCGWACPQTVYLELVYRPIERLLEGAPGRKKKQGAWRQPLRLIIYLVISLILAHTFLAYFVGTDRLFVWMTQSPIKHPISFLLVIAVTALMLFDFGFFREQLCIVACPYGRLQSVMLDKNSLIVGYDYNRGEPRGKLTRKRRKDAAELPSIALKVMPDEPRGDCIDCKMCVNTCPTGIDIRDGLQLECVHCTQCIDACDSVMTKIGKPKGLIRYSSQAALEGAKRRVLRPRVIIYPAALIAVFTLFVYLLITRPPAHISILRQPGTPYNVLESGLVSNRIRLKVHNQRDVAASYTISLPTIANSSADIDQGTFTLDPQQRDDALAQLIIPPEAFDHMGRLHTTVRVTDSLGYSRDVPVNLQGPYNAHASPTEHTND